MMERDDLEMAFTDREAVPANKTEGVLYDNLVSIWFTELTPICIRHYNFGSVETPIKNRIAPTTERSKVPCLLILLCSVTIRRRDNVSKPVYQVY
ncbi:MAG: hypothetical protein A4E35_00295 [Methanoregula sp. PtaU1.Bin051]|nr:MAG: hypothetical protein A4E35_00295 [Methanoregula sp. PtaU1.Bin051]